MIFGFLLDEFGLARARLEAYIRIVELEFEIIILNKPSLNLNLSNIFGPSSDSPKPELIQPDLHPEQTFFFGLIASLCMFIFNCHQRDLTMSELVTTVYFTAFFSCAPAPRVQDLLYLTG